MAQIDKTPTDQLTFEQLKEQIFAQVGKNLLRYQYIEFVIKNILSQSKLEITPTGLSEDTERRQLRTQKSTFGGLIDEFLELLETPQNESNNNDVHADTSQHEEEKFGSAPQKNLTTNMVFNTSTEEKETLSAALRDAVQQRNNLVHHFISQVSTTDLASMKKTLIDLEQQYGRVELLSKQISLYGRILTLSFQYMRNNLQKDLILSDLPDETRDVIHYIHEFCSNHQTEWVSINQACAYAKSNAPDSYAVVKKVSKVKSICDLLRSTDLFDFKQQATTKGHTTMIRVLPPNMEQT